MLLRASSGAGMENFIINRVGEEGNRNLNHFLPRGLDFFLEVASARRSEARNSDQFLPRGPKSELGSEVLSDFFPGPK